jgi:hypothetical protein
MGKDVSVIQRTGMLSCRILFARPSVMRQRETQEIVRASAVGWTACWGCNGCETLGESGRERSFQKLFFGTEFQAYWDMSESVRPP